MTIHHDPINLVITGVGGQGNVLVSRVIGSLFMNNGYHVTITDDVGVSQRAGSVNSLVRVSQKRQFSPIIPVGQGTVILGIEPLETLRVLRKFGNEEIQTVSNTRCVMTAGALLQRDTYPDSEALLADIERFSKKAWFSDATQVALDLNMPILTNVVMLGVLAGTELLPITDEEYEAGLKARLPEKVHEKNIEAFRKGKASVNGGSGCQK